METGKIDHGTILTATAGIAAVEWAISGAAEAVQADRLALVGFGRVLQVALILMLVWAKEKSLLPLGLTASGLPRGIFRGAAWSAGFAAVAMAAGAAMVGAGFDPLAYLASPGPKDGKEMILLLAVGGVVGPVAEEVFFRGVCYGYFRRWGIAAAVLLTTAVFVAAHAASSRVPVTQIVGGLIFAASYEIEKNLMVPVVIHVSGNLALFAVSWIA